jgi:hypothetical protein
MNNLSDWNIWVRFIFNTDIAKSKPWRKTGEHHMTWASRMLTEQEIRRDNGQFDFIEYSDITSINPETILLNKEEAFLQAA